MTLFPPGMQVAVVKLSIVIVGLARSLLGLVSYDDTFVLFELEQTPNTLVQLIALIFNQHFYSL